MSRVSTSRQSVFTKFTNGDLPKAPSQSTAPQCDAMQSCALSAPSSCTNASQNPYLNGLTGPQGRGVNLRARKEQRQSLLGRILRLIFVPTPKPCNTSDTPPTPEANNDPAIHSVEPSNTAFVSTTRHLDAIEQPNGNFGVNKSAIGNWSLSAEKREFYTQGFALGETDFQDDLIDGWHQTSEGNCVFVAGAKAAMDAYGTHAFKEIKADADGLTITMRDNKKIKVSAKELEKARSESDFAGNNEKLLAYATIMYAATAKRAQMQRHEGARSFNQALNALNNGEILHNSIKFLGLSDQLVSINPASLSNRDAVLACSDQHAIYVDKTNNGEHIADHYGEAVRYSGTDTWKHARRRRNRIHTAYTLKPLAESTILNTHNRENAG